MARAPAPLFAALRAPGRAHVPREALAALSLAAIALPEQLATARLMGLPPAAGLVAFLAGTLAFAAFGTHRTLSVGADSTIAPIMAAGLATLAVTGSPAYAALAAMLALMVGAVLVLARPLRLGWVADLLSIPVTTGFMAGIALHIIAGALPQILGLPVPAGELTRKLGVLARDLAAARPETMVLGFGVAALALAIDRLAPRLPGPLIALAASAGAAWALGATAIPMLDPLSLASLGGGPWAGHWELPDMEALAVLLPLALIVALVVMMQSAAVLQSFPDSQAVPADPGRDFAAIGAGSLLAGLLGSFAVNASPPRTAIAEAEGARSQWSALIAVALALGLAALAAGAIAHVPRAGLNGVLLVIGLRLIRPATLARIGRKSPSELVLALATTALVAVLPVMSGVGLAIVLSLMHAIYTIARPPCTELARVPGTTIWWSRPPGAPAEQEPGVLVFALGAPLNFINARYLLGRLGAAIRRKRPQLVVIEASGVINIDFTGSSLLQQAIADWRAAGIALALARLESTEAAAQAARTGLVAQLGADHVFLSVEEAVRALRPD
ncbi:SulP family inorganic anion transporter [Acidimangrovimonas pyrenivorans]|uniref:SulP family inorganic anion transporter n=1 Tax=Acidimangrovimonas pyrenivorans TaxID=2030798 RepID=A0ABV7AGL1_9RHOB